MINEIRQAYQTPLLYKVLSITTRECGKCNRHVAGSRETKKMKRKLGKENKKENKNKNIDLMNE